MDFIKVRKEALQSFIGWKIVRFGNTVAISYPDTEEGVIGEFVSDTGFISEFCGGFDETLEQIEKIENGEGWKTFLSIKFCAGVDPEKISLERVKLEVRDRILSWIKEEAGKEIEELKNALQRAESKIIALKRKTK